MSHKKIIRRILLMVPIFYLSILPLGNATPAKKLCPEGDTCVVIKPGETIKIAPMVSKTGATGFPTGKGQAQGLVVAHERRPQVHGHEIELVGNPSGLDDISLENDIILPNWDDGSSSAVGTAKANLILADDADADANDVVAILGLSNSTAASAVIPIFSAAKYLMLGTGVLGTELTRPIPAIPEPYFARTSPTGKLDALAMADFICGPLSSGGLALSRIATIHDGNTAFSQTVSQAFADQCKSHGATDVTDGVQGIPGVTGIKVITANPPISTDYTGALNALAADPDGLAQFIYHVSNTGAAGHFVRQIRTLPEFSAVFSSTLIGAASNYLSDPLWQAANGITPQPLPVPLPLAEGFLVSGYEFPSSNPLKKFFGDYDDLFGTLAPDSFPPTLTNLVPNAADAYNIVLDAVQNVAQIGPQGELRIPRKALRDALFFDTIDVQGITGILNCNQPSPGGNGPNFVGDCNPDLDVSITEIQCNSDGTSCAFVPQ